MPCETCIGRYHEQYPIELLENNTTPSPSVGQTHDTILLSADIVYDKDNSTFDDIVHKSHGHGFYNKEIGHYHIVPDELIDPVLLHWEVDHKTSTNGPSIPKFDPIFPQGNTKTAIGFVLNDATINNAHPLFGSPNFFNAGSINNTTLTTVTFAACENPAFTASVATSGHHPVTKPGSAHCSNAKTSKKSISKSNKKRKTGAKQAGFPRVPGMCYDCSVRPF